MAVGGYGCEGLRRGTFGGSPADLADYLLARGDEPCGRTVPEAILKAVAWMEKVAEFPLEDRATFGRIATAIKDTVVERLSWKAPFTKRAPRYPAAILVRFERIVRNRVVPVGWRIWAWAKLVKTWASFRWSDLQAMIPDNISFTFGRLYPLLRRTKTTGATRRIKELPVCVSEKAFFEDPSWLAEGFELLKQWAGYKRDYLLPRIKGDGTLERKMASYMPTRWRLRSTSWRWLGYRLWSGPIGRNTARGPFWQRG